MIFEEQPDVVFKKLVQVILDLRDEKNIPCIRKNSLNPEFCLVTVDRSNFVTKVNRHIPMIFFLSLRNQHTSEKRLTYVF